MRSILHRAARKLKYRPRSIRIAGRAYALPRGPLDLDPGHEPWLDAVFEAAMQIKEGAFIDVGVNQGQTLAKMLRIAPNNRYVGIEPQAACVFAVEEFIRINRLEHCTILPIGLSDHNGMVELLMHDLTPGDSTASIARAHRPESFYVQSKMIPVFRGDEVLSEDAISVIKIDVEGAELEVLRGLPETLSRHRPFVVFEVLSNYLTATQGALPRDMVDYRNERARQISTLFDEGGYSVFNIRCEALVPLKVIVPEVSADSSIRDYVAVPDEMVSEVKARFAPKP